MAKKIVNFCKGFWKDYESFDKFKKYVEKYFGCGAAHYNSLYVNGFFVYNQEKNLTSILKNCANCELNQKQKFYIYIEDFYMKVPEVFFDWYGLDMNNKFCKLLFIKASTTEKFICHYCPRYNILSATDWTHNNKTVEFAISIFPMVVKIFQLSETKKKEVEENLFKILKITIGTDPEFEELRDHITYRPIPTRYRGLNCEIGADGSGLQIELRPKPSRNPVILVRNVRNLIVGCGVPMSVKGDVYPLGGHIHLGFSKHYLALVGYNIKKIVSVLDDFIGIPLLPLSGKARERGGYKRLSAYEFKPWGFEYRTPPSAYLLDPKMAHITFKIARNVVKSLIENGYIEYDTPPSFKDYNKYAKLTAEEYEYFIFFIRNYPSYRGTSITSNWGRCDFKVPLSILFRDTWNKSLKKYLKSLLDVKVESFVRVIFYGLRRDRGEVVSGIEIEGFTTIPTVISHDPDDIVIGLPYWVRTGERGMEKSKEILEIVARKVIERVGVS